MRSLEAAVAEAGQAGVDSGSADAIGKKASVPRGQVGIGGALPKMTVYQSR